MAMIRERRNLNIVERFRKPEYWPFSSAGEKVDNTLNLSDITEDFGIPLPIYQKAILIGTDTFESGTTGATWVDAGTGTYSYVTDPAAGASHGRVKKVQFTTAQQPFFYAETFGSTTGNLQGIYSGKLDFYMYSDLTSPTFQITVTNRSTSDPQGKGYDLAHSFVSSNRFDIIRHGTPDLSDFTVGTGSKSITANAWHNFVIEWYSYNHPFYGDLFYMYYTVDGVQQIRSAPSSIAYFGDWENIFWPRPLPQDDQTVRITFWFKQAVGGTHFILLDSVSFYKYQGVTVQL